MEDLLNSTGDLPPAISQYKHFPISADSAPNARGYASRNHFIRANAKRQAQSKSSNLCRDTGLPCTTATFGTPHCYRCGEDNTLHPSARRPQLERVLRTEISTLNLGPGRNVAWLGERRARRSRNRPEASWSSNEVEGQDLARSNVPLPSDRFRLVRKPTLEREEAFRDASTAKLRRSQTATDDAEVAELYRMGLLYDDEQDRGEGFDLNSIEHEEPVYSIRPAKRSRKNKKSHSFSFNEPLHLDLSFTDLGGDQTIAQFLASSSEASDDGDIPEASSRSFAPLRVIYELDGSQPSFDVDTSQPPDLVSDLLSDYDCFSDSDLDDLPSQREVRDSAAAPSSDTWVVLGDDS
ncbi:hypothetical protein FDECE_8722 [Fusarium decemcellulare]|nr:hypothetical protein FDECE_8722 [Fusarium decemcellulare]